jgi:hypothetical protein
MVHELIHVIANASHFMKIYLTEDTDEFHAYYAEWITKQVMKRVTK